MRGGDEGPELADRDWIGQVSWTYQESDMYAEAWESSRGDLLYIEDTYAEEHGIYGQLFQSTLDDFSRSRYQVNLNTVYRPSEDPFSLDEFDTERDAAAYIRQLTYPG